MRRVEEIGADSEVSHVSAFIAVFISLNGIVDKCSFQLRLLGLKVSFRVRARLMRRMTAPLTPNS